ncbi:MAG TPA: hypothetical protein DEB31_04195 [Clostridiales bacterium]|nr:hypothetical protein [Clostridiales bacterium]
MAGNVLTSRKRLLVLLILLAVLMVLLVFRVGYWNIVRGEDLQEEAETQWISDSPVAAKRGSILDRNQNVLAQSAVSDTVVLMPNTIKEKDEQNVAITLAAILEMEPQAVYEKVTTKETTRDDGTKVKLGEVWLKRQITNEQTERINMLLENNELPGVKLIADTKRFYPNKDFLSQVIGYATMDGEGQTGIERRYNSVLEGRQGRMVAEKDKYGNDIPNGREMLIESVDGSNVILTIDDVLQSFLETECGRAMEELPVESVQGLVMDVTAGEVLAMANMPDFDLNEPPRSDGAVLSALSANIVTASSYEPGNIMQVFTLAAAIDAGMVRESYECTGKRLVDGEEIVCGHAHGVQTPEQVLQNGCNVCASEMATELGKEKLLGYLRGFGFGEQTGIDFSTDAKGELMALKYVSESDLAKIGAGYNMSASLMQIANAAAALINGGTLYEPRLVYGLGDSEGAVIERYEAQAKGNPVSAETASQVREYLRQNVLYGDAGQAAMGEYSSGALYGSLQKYDADGLPVQGKEISVFLEFAPAENPKYLVMLSLNGLDTGEGSDVAAAPYAKNVLESILKYTYVEPDRTGGGLEAGFLGSDVTTVTVPDVVEMGMQGAIDTLAALGLGFTKDGAGTVQEQYPAAGEQAEQGTKVHLVMSHKSQEPEEEGGTPMVTVPDLTGMDFAGARDTAIGCGLHFYAQGAGVAAAQYPVAGSEAPEGSFVTVTFKLKTGT